MADSQKNNVLVVVLVLLGLLSTSCYGFTQELQRYKDEITRRSFNVMEYFEKDSMLTRIGGPAYLIVTFFVALYQVVILISGWLPSFGFGIPLLGAPPTEMIKARDGEQREQRLLDAIDDQVKAAVIGGLSEFENELKKKKK